MAEVGEPPCFNFKPYRDWAVVEASAPGKFILCGEYGVVYGRQAIAIAVNLRTTVRVRPRNDNKIRLILKQLNYSCEWKANIFNLCKVVTKPNAILDYTPSLISKLNALAKPNGKVTIDRNFSSQAEKEAYEKKTDDATNAFLLLYLGVSDSYFRSARPSFDIEVDSTIPIGSGLGSSSAYAVAMCGAMMRVFCASVSKTVINDWAHNIDKLFHGKPSGIDNSTIVHGGYILFQCNAIKSQESPKKSNLRVLLIDSCVSRSTKVMIEKITNQLVENEDRVMKIFDNMNEITSNIWAKLNASNLRVHSLAPEIKDNQELLDSLGVGHEKLTSICQIAQRHGVAAKLTGAGGGGMAIALYETNCLSAKNLKHELLSQGYKLYDLECGTKGLDVDVTPEFEIERFNRLGKVT